MVKRIPFGSYSEPDVFIERLHVRSGRYFTFYMHMHIQRSDNGRGESNIIALDGWSLLRFIITSSTMISSIDIFYFLLASKSIPGVMED